MNRLRTCLQPETGVKLRRLTQVSALLRNHTNDRGLTEDIIAILKDTAGMQFNLNETPISTKPSAASATDTGSLLVSNVQQFENANDVAATTSLAYEIQAAMSEQLP